MTLVELVVVILIAGILATVVLRSAGVVSETVKVEEAKQEMDMLAKAIVGSPDLEYAGFRSDFGYVGDVGAFPPDLGALVSNPGGFTTWKGPYVKRRFEQITSDFKEDPWGAQYSYSGGVLLTSTGSGTDIVRKFGNTTADFLNNQVTGLILDRAGAPPGSSYRDSVTVILTRPDGAGGVGTYIASTDAGGYFAFDSVPIGNHTLQLVYEPADDSLRRFVSVLPGSVTYDVYHLAASYWSDTISLTGRMELVAGSDTLLTANCNRLVFSVTNPGTDTVTVGSLVATWTLPVAYYSLVKWDGTVVRSGSPPLGSGDAAVFMPGRALGPADTVQITLQDFRTNPGGGGPPVDMTGTAFAFDFSDGSTVSFTSSVCD